MYNDKFKHNYYAFNDFNIKFPNNHPYNKPQLKHIKFTLSNNFIIQNPKQLIPLINISQSITSQFPSLIKAKKSVASFKLRKNSPIGITTTLRGKNAQKFLNILNYYIFPRLSLNESTKKENYYTVNSNSLYLGYNNITIFSYLTPL